MEFEGDQPELDLSLGFEHKGAILGQDQGMGWQARCACEWFSPIRDAYYESRNDLEAHYNSMLRNRHHPKSLMILWNRVVAGKLPIAKGMSYLRVAHCRARQKERPMEEWKLIFEMMAKSDFLCGKNDRGWKADFTWIIKNDSNYLKVLEGKYENERFKRFPRPGLLGETQPKEGEYEKYG